MILEQFRANIKLLAYQYQTSVKLDVKKGNYNNFLFFLTENNKPKD